MSSDRKSGVYNATGAPDALTRGQLLETIRLVSDSDATFTWVDDNFLLEQQVRPFDELPFWVPPESEGVFKVNVDRAIAAGLAYRPIVETVEDTLAWLAADPALDKTGDAVSIALESGLVPDREAALLQAWHRLRAQI